VAAGPKLRRRWRNARATDSPLAERVGAALVAAAIDCRRAGLARPAPEPILRDLLPSYLADVPDAGPLGETVIAGGFGWATDRVQATSALLTWEAGGYVVFDYLLDQIQRAPNAPPVPGVVWERLLVDPTPEDAAGVGIAAYQAGQWPIAERALRVAADAGDHRAESDLGFLLEQQGKLDEADRWYRRAADAGHHEAERNLGVLLHQRGRLVEAERWYRRAADAGDHDAEYNLGDLLHKRGELTEAEGWYRKAADAGDHDAERRLGVVLEALGRVEEAEGWYRKAADAGDEDAADALMWLLATRPRPPHP
jgi:Flp pilus assembly protein TadD